MFRKELREIFSPRLISLDPDDSALDAVQLMRQHDVSCVVIQEKGWPVGIFYRAFHCPSGVQPWAAVPGSSHHGSDEFSGALRRGNHPDL